MANIIDFARALFEALEQSPGDNEAGQFVYSEGGDMKAVTIDGYFDLNRACERMFELLVAPKAVPANLTVAQCPHCGRHLMVADAAAADTADRSA